MLYVVSCLASPCHVLSQVLVSSSVFNRFLCTSALQRLQHWVCMSKRIICMLKRKSYEIIAIAAVNLCKCDLPAVTLLVFGAIWLKRISFFVPFLFTLFFHFQEFCGLFRSFIYFFVRFVFVFIHRSNWCVFTNRPQLKYANEFQCRKQFIQLSKQIDGWNSSSNVFLKWWKLKQWHKIIQSHFNDFWTYLDITNVAKCATIFIYAIFLAFFHILLGYIEKSVDK